jgi:hypothetical protein
MTAEFLEPSSSPYATVPVPELGAHAKGLPHLAYLLGISQEVPLLSPHGVVMVALVEEQPLGCTRAVPEVGIHCRSCGLIGYRTQRGRDAAADDAPDRLLVSTAPGLRWIAQAGTADIIERCKRVFIMIR